MARTRIQPNFRAFAALQSEPAKGSPDTDRNDAPEKADGDPHKREKLTISQYRDPRDWLDHQRHAMRAEVRLESELSGDDPPEAKRQ